MARRQRRNGRWHDAHYYILRMDPTIAGTFTPEQRNEILATLNSAMRRPAKKIVELRFTLPVFFSRYFFVVFVGRDRRHVSRTSVLGTSVRVANALFVLMMAMFITSFLIVVIFLILYFAKCALGIDIIKNWHLFDLFGFMSF